MSLFKNPKVIYRALALIVLAVVVYFASTHILRESSVDVRWPTHSQSHTMLLRPATTPESLRLIDYAKDQVTITAMRIEYRDGSTALVKYEAVCQLRSVRFTRTPLRQLRVRNQSRL